MHLDLPVFVDDLDRARAFYGGLLGVEIPLLELVQEGRDRDNRDYMYAEGQASVYFEVDDVHDEHRRLVASGVRTVMGPATMRGQDFVYVDDGVGNVVELFVAARSEPLRSSEVRDPQGAIDFYNETPADDIADGQPRTVWLCGAALTLCGVVGNGGLVGTVENARETGTGELLADGAAGLRLVGLVAAADLVERADREYRRMRPSDCSDELSPADERLWDELDEAWWPLGEEAERVLEERLTAG